MNSRTFLAAALVWGGLGTSCATPAAAADKARLTGLSDVAFGLIAATTDQSASQSVCAFSSSATNGYSVTAVGSGTGGAFTVSSSSAQMSYEVQWVASANQTGGTALTAGTTTSGFTSVASQQTCNSGPNGSASLTVIIRLAALTAAMAGDYSGTLQITIAPE
jgi:hypothetical protein